MRIIAATDMDVIKATQLRSAYGNKKDNGRIAVIAGSREYHSAPSLAANAVYNLLAGLRVGTGYAYLYVPDDVIDAVRALTPSMIVRRFGGDYIGSGDLSTLKRQLSSIESIVIGMGIGRNPPALRMSSKIIDYAVGSGKKIVVDADGIYSIKHVKRLNSNVVLTPHDREFEELSGHIPNKRSLRKRAVAAVSLSRKLDCCVLLKGHDTVITDGNSVKVVRSKSSALATMGTGDVLAGIIGGYMATGTDAFRSAVAGAYVHSRIGDMLYRRMGNHIISSDVVSSMPAFLKRFDKNVE